jgi:hypothetical protein
MLWLALLASSGAALALAVLPDADSDISLGVNLGSKATARSSDTSDTSDTRGIKVSKPTPATNAASQNNPNPNPKPNVRLQNWPAPSSAAQAAWAAPAAPPPPRAAPAPAAEAPKPPPFPYQWLGRLDDGQQAAQIFLGSPQRSYAVSEGQSPDQQWRIDRVVDGQLQVTWLATGETVTVAAR